MKPFNVICVLSLLLIQPAWADVVDPTEEVCTGAEVGDPCNADEFETGSNLSGTCQEDECCRNDYTNGSPPETVCEPCLTCQMTPDEPDAEAEAETETESADVETQDVGGMPSLGSGRSPSVESESEAPGGDSDDSGGCRATVGQLGPRGTFIMGLILALGLVRRKRTP